ncbi:GNAT family N-acetyltransferase, partial [Chromobacterium piscinae]
GPGDHRPLVIRIEDEAGQVVGGLWGYTRYGWLYTELLSAPTGARGLGLGRRLMEAAEAEARTRGCVGAWVDTHSFQAP